MQEMKDKPFVLLGVNSDPRAKLKSIIEDKTVTWPCWFDGGDALGPIASQWNVTGWPTIYIIDKEGVIRAKHFDEQLVKKLVQAK